MLPVSHRSVTIFALIRTFNFTCRHWGQVSSQCCDDGFFHADPHPGNFFIEADERIGLIDFGMVGKVDERTQELFGGSSVLDISREDAERLVDVFLELGVTQERVNRDFLRRDVQHLLKTYWGRALKEVKIGQLLTEVFTVMRNHHLHLPSNLALLLKTVIMIEGLGTHLDPDFQLARVLAPYTERLVYRQYLPSRWIPRLGRASIEMAPASWFSRRLRRLPHRLAQKNENISPDQQLLSAFRQQTVTMSSELFRACRLRQAELYKGKEESAAGQGLFSSCCPCQAAQDLGCLKREERVMEARGRGDKAA